MYNIDSLNSYNNIHKYILLIKNIMDVFFERLLVNIDVKYVKRP